MNNFKLYFYLMIIIVFITSCAILESHRYYNPIITDEFKLMPVENANYIDKKFQYKFTHLEKIIFDKSNDSIGKFIIKRFGKDNDKMILFGPFIPFMPEFFSGKPEPLYINLLDVGIKFYDTCKSYNKLNRNSFCLVTNLKDTIYADAKSYRKDNNKCALEKNIQDSSKYKYYLFYSFNKTSKKQKIKSLQLTAVDKEAEAILKTMTLKEKNKLVLRYEFLN